jgi:hypothetical protein
MLLLPSIEASWWRATSPDQFQLPRRTVRPAQSRVSLIQRLLKQFPDDPVRGGAQGRKSAENGGKTGVSPAGRRIYTPGPFG